MSAGPTIYAQLMDKALDAPRQHLADELKARTNAFLLHLEEHWAESLRQAYVAGVQDGFHEGLAAARWDDAA